jgi:hypothetical protein
MTLSKKAKAKITDAVKMKMALDLQKAYSTVDRWVRYENDKLATLKTIEAIKQHTGLTQDEIFEI